MNYNKIAERQKSIGMSLAELARRTGLTPNGISKIIREKNTKIDTLESISKALGVSMSFWWEEENWEIQEGSRAAYGETSTETIRRLNRQIEDLIDDKARLKREIDGLNERIGFGKDGTSG